MSEKFEIEYFTDMSSGPRYVVDAETGDIRRDESFISGEAAVSDDVTYPGTPEVLNDTEVAEEAYEEILGSGIKPGEFYEEDLDVNERGVRVQVYDDESEGLERVSEVEREFIDRAVEGLEEAF
ncbi:MAG: hypothetical protein ABEK04_00755 [Candidatus Nanohalobium sp.]